MNTKNKKEKNTTSYFTAETLNTFPLDVNLMTGNKKSDQTIDDKMNSQNRKDNNERCFRTNK